MTLGEYLAQAARTPWQPGVHDCCTFPGNWVLNVTGHDPMVQWRGYTTEAEAQSFIDRAGGLVWLWTHGLEGIAHIVRGAPQAGDVAVIETGKGDIGGLFTGKRWAFVGDRLCFVSVDPTSIARMWRPANHG